MEPTAAGERHEVVLAGPDAGQRLDRVLSERLAAVPGLSRTRLQGLIEVGSVTVDGRTVRDSSAKLPGTGVIQVSVPAAVPAVPQGEPIPLAIVFEDAHLLVLDKPAGLVVHPAAGHDDGTLVNALIAHCGDSLSGIGGVRRPGIVHRLDKETSGLMVVAKSDAAHAGLVALFADHGRSTYLERCYLAAVWGEPPEPSGTVDRPLGRHPHQRDRMSVVPEARGRRAVTHWRRLEAFTGASLLECRLETGRTHQIRVHLTAIGHPVIGDPVYGTGFRTKAAHLRPGAIGKATAFPRQALHAATLGFAHPVTGDSLVFSRPPPTDMAALLLALREG